MHLLLVVRLRVGHPVVDPETTIDGVSIIDHHKFLTVFFVPGLNLGIDRTKSLVQGNLIDFGASVTDFIVGVEIGIQLS